jgi:hypothetical protein
MLLVFRLPDKKALLYLKLLYVHFDITVYVNEP